MYNHLLDTFLVVADTGSFSKAAEVLFISAPAVMKQMNLLEEQLGLQLIKRTHQGITLTKVGHSIYEDAKKIIALSEEAMTRGANLVKNMPLKIKIGSSLLNPSQQIASLLSKVTKENSQFHFEIIPFDDNKDTIISVLHQLGKTYDIIPGSYTSEITAKLANYYELYKVTFTVAIPRKHPLAQKEILEISDLFGETLVSGKSSPNRPVGILQGDLARKYPEIQQETASEFYDMNVFNNYVKSNKLLLSLPQWQYVQPNFITLPVNWEYQNTFGLLYPLQPSREVIKFLEYVEIIQNNIG